MKELMEKLGLENIKEELILEAIPELTEKEQLVLKRRFRLEEGPKTLRALGAELHCTMERVRQIEAKALRKLRRKIQEGRHI